MNDDLFATAQEGGGKLALSEGACLLKGCALPDAPALLDDFAAVLDAAPLRHMETPWGARMSVGMSNCGRFGWTSSTSGYRYTEVDPLSGVPWPRIPTSFLQLARRAAAEAGFTAFEPDACLVNVYEPGARLSPHQDRNERCMAAPIVSLSLGLPAIFLWGGPTRRYRLARVPLHHGDVVVWGGPSRLHYHGVMPVEEGCHPIVGARRINLTFRFTGLRARR